MGGYKIQPFRSTRFHIQMREEAFTQRLKGFEMAKFEIHLQTIRREIINRVNILIDPVSQTLKVPHKIPTKCQVRYPRWFL